MERVYRLLMTVLGLGILAAVILIVVVVAVLINRNQSSKVAVSPHPSPFPTAASAPTVPPTPGPVATVAPVVSPSTQCARSGSNCNLALLNIINRDRIHHGRTPYTLDSAQSSGVVTTGAGRRCPGSQGHSAAMALSGFTWRKNSHYPRDSYPRDICVSVHASAETVASASGPEWAALKRIERRTVAKGSHNSAYRRLLSRRFKRIGIGIAHRGNRTYLTEDFLR